MNREFRKCKRIPIVMQMEGTECGAASLAMVLAYHKLILPLEQLREDCGVSRDGSKASNIAKAAMRYGMEVHMYRYGVNNLMKKATFPAILCWNYSHFVVLQGFEKGKALINDPARGRIKVSMDEFEKCYSEFVITMQPTEQFKPGGKRDSVWQFAKQNLHGSRSILILLMITGVFAAVGSLVVPAFSRVFTDDVLTSGAKNLLNPLLVIMALTALFLFVANLFHQKNTYKVQGKLAASSNASFLWHILHLPMRFFSQRQAGDVATRQGLNDAIAQTLVSQIAPLLNEVILLILYLVIMLRYSIVLSIIGLSSIGLTALSGVLLSRLTVESGQRQARDMALVSSATYTAIDMIETIKVSGAENGYFEQWSGYLASSQASQVEQEKKTRFLAVLPGLIQEISNIAVLLVGAKLIMDGYFSAGMLIAFQSVLRFFMKPAQSLVAAVQSILQMRTSMERVADVMKYPEQSSASEDLEDDIEYNKLSGNIELNNVSFGYSPLEEPLLQDFNLTIKPGQKIALVGKSGCGKSTVLKLLSGLYEPWAGQILYDGKKKLDIPKDVFSGSLMVVDQDSYFFADSIYENIKLWDETISDAEAIQASIDAQIHDNIMSRPGGYEYHMIEGGKDFSGGQRQCLEVATVLSGNPTIALFDEATSALDAKTEYELTKAVSERGITMVVAAHRLSTIRDSDLILVMEKGRVVQQGRHEELIQQDGPYRDLVTTQ